MTYPPKGRYRHYKGKEYELLFVARHSETDEPLVIYRALYPCPDTPLGEGVWARPLSMWLETVTVGGRTIPRFQYLGDAASDGIASSTKPVPSERTDSSAQDEITPIDAAPPKPFPSGEGAAPSGSDDLPPSEKLPGGFPLNSACQDSDAALPSPDAPLTLLRRFFGYASFRPGQREIISACLEGRDVLGVMPTGAGKSLCYQIPALALEGTALVISPLISLMKDQVGALRQLGVSAAFINSSLSESQIARALAKAEAGEYKLIYVAPERLLTPRFEALCRSLPISLVAVDEAHCISQWGQDFRPSYLDIPSFISRLPRRPCLCAYTATATLKVRGDIRSLLGLRDPFELVTGFDRPNLYFNVLRPADKMSALMDLMRTYSGMSGIVYCATRKTVEEVCEALVKRGVNASRYHAGLDEDERRANQDAFSLDEVPVMVATNAFGMGIDKSNVRFVIHYNLPKDPESYYQEAGRAGRDGERADCVLLYSPADLVTQGYFIDRLGEEAGLDEPTRRTLQSAARKRLNAMKSYACGAKCLRASLLEYFGEPAPEKCGRCAVCDGLIRQADATQAARTALALVKSLRVNYGAGTLVDVLRGSRGEAVLSRRLDKAPQYGALRELSRARVDELLERMLDEGALRRLTGDFPVIAPGPRADELEAGDLRVLISDEPPRAAKRRQKTPAGAQGDTGLLAELKKLRMQLARKLGIPPFMVFSDASLSSMAALMPHTQEEFRQVHGVGEAKCRTYAAAFIGCIRGWEKANQTKKG